MTGETATNGKRGYSSWSEAREAYRERNSPPYQTAGCKPNNEAAELSEALRDRRLERLESFSKSETWKEHGYILRNQPIRDLNLSEIVTWIFVTIDTSRVKDFTFVCSGKVYRSGPNERIDKFGIQNTMDLLIVTHDDYGERGHLTPAGAQRALLTGGMKIVYKDGTEKIFFTNHWRKAE